MLFNQPNNRFMSCVVNEILLCTMNAQKRHGKNYRQHQLDLRYIGLSFSCAPMSNSLTLNTCKISYAGL